VHHDRDAVRDAVRYGRLSDLTGFPPGGASTAARLPAAEQARLAIRDLPEYAYAPEPTQ
jgi:hypothetical protein